MGNKGNRKDDDIIFYTIYDVDTVRTDPGTALNRTFRTVVWIFKVKRNGVLSTPPTGVVTDNVVVSLVFTPGKEEVHTVTDKVEVNIIIEDLGTGNRVP